MGLKGSNLARDAENGFEGDIYDYVRKYGVSNLQVCRHNHDTIVEAATKDMAKLLVIEEQKKIDKYNSHMYDDRIEDLLQDNIELNESKDNQKSSVIIAIDNTIKLNNIQIQDYKQIVRNKYL